LCKDFLETKGVPRDRVASTRGTEARIRDRTQGESPVLETGHQVSSILTSLTKAPRRAQDKFAHHGNVAFLPLKAAPDGLGALTGWHFICTEEQCRFDSCHFHQFGCVTQRKSAPFTQGQLGVQIPPCLPQPSRISLQSLEGEHCGTCLVTHRVS
jgi:hypothetical protein